MARPCEYNFELCKEICEQVSLGKNIKAVLDSDDRFPCFKTFCNWKRDFSELLHLYVNAHQDKAEALEDELDLYRDMMLAGEIDSKVYNVLAQTLKWKMSKFYPKMFGDNKQIDVTTAGNEIKSSPTIVFTDTPNEEE